MFGCFNDIRAGGAQGRSGLRLVSCCFPLLGARQRGHLDLGMTSPGPLQAAGETAPTRQAPGGQTGQSPSVTSGEALTERCQQRVSLVDQLKRTGLFAVSFFPSPMPSRLQVFLFCSMLTSAEPTSRKGVRLGASHAEVLREGGLSSSTAPRDGARPAGNCLCSPAHTSSAASEPPDSP